MPVSSIDQRYQAALDNSAMRKFAKNDSSTLNSERVIEPGNRTAVPWPTTAAPLLITTDDAADYGKTLTFKGINSELLFEEEIITLQAGGTYTVGNYGRLHRLRMKSGGTNLG